MSEEVMSNELLDTGNPSTESSLQTEMTGDFFDYDDGLGAVVNQNGDPFTKDDGKYYSSIEEYKSSLNKSSVPDAQQQKPQAQQSLSNANAKQPVQLSQAQVQSNGFDSFYKKDTGFDIASILSDAPKFNEFSYQREINPIAQVEQSGLQQPQADPKTADANTLKEYREGLENSALKPIERAYQNAVAYYQQQGQQIPEGVFNALNAEYCQLKTAIDNLVSEKKDALLEARFKEREETANFSKIEEKSVENFDRISSQYFPSMAPEQSRDRLNKLIFGFTDNTGKFTRGFGADIIDHAFDLANNGKTFKTKEEWSDAYSKWWSKYASNPKNISYVAQRAWDRFIASNIDGLRDGYRSTWEQEQREKLKQSQQNPHATRGGNIGQVDSAQAQMNAYFTPPQRAM